MSFEWFIARRYLVARRRQAFISLISLVSILGVGVGVMALIVALALMTGVQSELRDRIVGSTAHIQAFKIGGSADADADVRNLRGRPGVTGAAPAIIGAGLLLSRGTDSGELVMIKGINPALEPEVTDIGAAMQSGSLAALNQPAEGPQGVVLGAELAVKLGLKVGDTIQIYTPVLTLGPFGPRPQLPPLLQVVGTFKLGFYQYDSGYAFVTLSTAEHMLAKAGPDFIQLRLARLEDAPRVREELQAALGSSYLVQDWTQLNKELYSALSLEKFAISLTIGLIVMVAALNIVASLVLLVMEKSPDIAILRTMGASAQAIRRVFMYQGLAIGLIGTLTGTVLGLVVSHVCDRYRLIPLNADVYQIDYLPFRVLPLDVAVVVVSAVAVCYLATLYPSRQAGRLDPAEALRNL
jgi:lipoprotein-releasing system permease protein